MHRADTLKESLSNIYFLWVQTFLALVIVVLAWTIGLLWIESAGYPAVSSSTGFVTYAKNNLLALMILFHIFGLLWLLQFIIACQHMVRLRRLTAYYMIAIRFLRHCLTLT